MNDFIELNEDNKKYLIVLKELKPKDKGYIIIKKCTKLNYIDIIDETTNILKSHNAKDIYMTLPSDIVSGDEINTKKYTYNYDSKMISMIYNIDDNLCTKDLDNLKFVPLSIINSASFIKIYNECFFDVPNSATYTDEDIYRLLEDNKCKGSLIQYNGEYVGICEIDYKNDIPEIASIGILNNFRNNGLGHKSLGYIMNKLYKTNFNSVKLLVSSKNIDAYNLYIKYGFKYENVKSIWYKCKI